MKNQSILGLAVVAALLAGCAGLATHSTGPAPVRTIILVWDGLRPDSVTAVDTPNLARLRDTGANFTDQHATYPTFTMMNGSSFATGAFPHTSGFYGNTFWTPPQGEAGRIPAGPSAAGTPQDYVDPVFTEDYQVLATLNDYYDGQLLLVKSLFATAQEHQLVTATIGKSGAAYLQDLGRGGLFLDENSVLPRAFATELQQAGYALPANTVHGFAGADAVVLAAGNGSPTARANYLTFNTTAFDPAGKLAIASRDPTDASQGAPEDAANKYMMSVFTQYILPKKHPMLSLVWFRTPDNTEHGYGPGSANARAGLRSQDARLGELLAALRAQGIEDSTNVIVVSDHGHSSVSGPLSLYPLRAIPAGGAADGPLVNGAPSGTTRAAVGGLDPRGYSFSGDVRSADLLHYRGFDAYDGAGCVTDSMFGLDAAGRPTIPVRADDAAGSLCGKAGAKYQAVSADPPADVAPAARFPVPAAGELPAHAVVVAANGGSDYFYVPGHDAGTIRRLVRFLQGREEYGAIFVDRRYGSLPGTLDLALINLENPARRDRGQPDVVVSFQWDAQTEVQGVPGIEFESFGAGQRGMHGSFGPNDVHNTLIAHGPSFRPGAVTTPTGNVDLAPTVAWLLGGLTMPQADGRVLNEALVAPASPAALKVAPAVIRPNATATGLTFELPSDPTGATRDAALAEGSYTVVLGVKDVSVDGKVYRYFDYARAERR